jgi:hypothetical protein
MAKKCISIDAADIAWRRGARRTGTTQAARKAAASNVSYGITL